MILIYQYLGSSSNYFIQQLKLRVSYVFEQIDFQLLKIQTAKPKLYHCHVILSKKFYKGLIVIERATLHSYFYFVKNISDQEV